MQEVGEDKYVEASTIGRSVAIRVRANYMYPEAQRQMTGTYRARMGSGFAPHSYPTTLTSTSGHKSARLALTDSCRLLRIEGSG